MRNSAILRSLSLVCMPALFCHLAFGQSGATPPANADQQFAMMHASLVRAADSTLEFTQANDPANNSVVPRISERQPIPAVRDSGRRTQYAERFGTLQTLVQPILARVGVPNELAAVMLVESAGNPLALSPKGARGLWQLMPDTARRYGLTVDGQRDDRVDLEKSTAGAARYLRDLYAQFGSWPLALAAYNTGEQNLQRAINRGRSKDFTTLSLLGYLPAETRNYVPAVISKMGSDKLPSRTSALTQAPVTRVYALSGQ